MCGICGIYRERAGDPRQLEAAAAKMSAALAHRGPDDQGVWADGTGRIAVANRRLAIIDLSAAGHQPMADAGNEVVLTYNGAIYNFPDLREELSASGYRFRGHSDTEVVLALYLRYGVDMCWRLRGMFAFAIWDGRTGQLLLARDRLGIKPLYYAAADGQWVFASEIRAIRASGLIPAAADPVALAAFLRLGSVPSPQTAYAHVRELPPASTLILNRSGGDAIIHRYWEVPEPCGDDGDTARVAKELRDRFSDSVTRHLISDVPVGVFLSGGMDSAAIVAMMREAGHTRIRTFSIGFAESEFDEGADAERLAVRYGTEHTAHQVRGGDVAEDLDGIIAAMDQPTVDGINTYYVSQAARAAETVVALSGLGGDELFCGYPSFRQVPRILAWRRAAARLGPARSVLAAALAAVPSHRSGKLSESLTEPATVQSAYYTVRGLLSRDEIMDLLAPGPLRDAAQHLDAAAAYGGLAPALPDDAVAATGVLELRGYMHNQLLRDTDVMSMRHSLEVRVPFLDHPLVEFASELPGRFRADGHPPKWILRRAMGDRLPPDAGLTKRGFGFPMGPWLAGPLRVHVDRALTGGSRMFRAEAAARLQAEVRSGRAHWSRLWAAAVLVLWLRAAGLPEPV